MIKKKQSTSYTSGMSTYDDQRASGEPSSETKHTPGGGKPIASGHELPTNGNGAISKDTGGVDQLGTQDNPKHDPARLIIACNRISQMITLPKLTGYALILFLVVISWMLFFPYNPIQFNQLPIPVLNENKEVVQGGELVLLMDYNKKQKCDLVEAEYFLIDGFVIKMNVDSRVRPVGENKTPRIIPIPTSAPVGTERHIQIDYSCKPNPLRTIYYTWTTEEFTILPSSN